MSAEERTGWRCEEISRRHREWGFNCPGVDLDFVMCEYNYGLPVALIEYKDRRARPPEINHPTYRALRSLADGYKNGAIPFFIATYCPERWWFIVRPLNKTAEEHYKHCSGGEVLNEQRFVKSLYLLRKQTLTASDELVISKLNSDDGPQYAT